MKEVRIQCMVGSGHRVEDLGLQLHYNQIEYIDADKANKSKDLAWARRVGAVEVRIIVRGRMAKKLPDPPRPAPPSVRMSRPARKPPGPAPAAKPEIDMEEVARRAEAAAASASERAVEKALAGFAAQPMVSQEMLEAALRNVLGPGGVIGSTPQTAAAPPAQTPDAHPVFIPMGIVPTDVKVDISVETEATEAKGLDEAAAALKAAKPKRRTRKKAAKKE